MQRKSSPKSTGAERKQRRFEERDRRIRDEAVKLFLDRGLAAFSMDDIASAIDYSKGTVYLHYTSKEDVLLAALAVHLEQITLRMEHAATLPLRPRTRMRAIAEVDLAHQIAHPEVLPISTAFISPTLFDKAPEERKRVVGGFYTRNNATEGGIVREAISRGDLVLPADRRPDMITFALSATYFGSMYIAAQGSFSRQITLEQMRPRILANVEVVMDGVRWQPMGGTDEHAAEAERLREALPALLAHGRPAAG